MSEDLNAAIRDYWETPGTISIIDSNLHELEIQAVQRHLMPTDRLADVGCGDGEATLRYASKVRECVGFERSQTLRAKAEAAAARSGLKNVSFHAADILHPSADLSGFDVVVSQRMLINLASWEEQQQGIRNLHAMLKLGGRAILIENTNEAFAAMNDLRVKMGLSPVPQHWHNRFFGHDELMRFVQGGFQLVRMADFGLYYLLTRVYTQMFASFEGWGRQAVKDPIFEHADRAARLLFEQIGDRTRIDGCPAFGPIQVFVLRREADRWS